MRLAKDVPIPPVGISQPKPPATPMNNTVVGPKSAQPPVKTESQATPPVSSTVTNSKAKAVTPEGKSPSGASKEDSVVTEPAAIAVAKRARKSKPQALKKGYTIEVHVTLEQRDNIEQTASSLGLSMSEYMLRCEQKAAHDVAVKFVTYIETRARVQEEKMAKIAADFKAVLHALKAPSSIA